MLTLHYDDFAPRGQEIASEPINKWKKPSCVLMVEGKDLQIEAAVKHLLEVVKE